MCDQNLTILLFLLVTIFGQKLHGLLVSIRKQHENTHKFSKPEESCWAQYSASGQTHDDKKKNVMESYNLKVFWESKTSHTILR